MDITSPISNLSDEHYLELRKASAISEDQIRSRCYRTVKAADLPDSFADYQRRDGLLIPIRNARGVVMSYQLKPNEPRSNKDGKPIKYETAANSRQMIDIPVSAVMYLDNPKIPLVITEGAKKVDAAVTAGWRCTIGLQGVFGWRGKGEQGGKTALPDWEQIALNDRKVVIAFDSDVMSKASVRVALDRLSAFLKSRGAQVLYLLMPDLEHKDGTFSKCGLDDWFAWGRTLSDLERHVKSSLPQLPDASMRVERPKVVSLGSVQSKHIEWLWQNWLPKGMLTLLGGYAGDGKSTITMSLAATFSTAGLLPDGSQAPKTNTLLMLAEDDLSHVVKPRLELHGGDMERILCLQHIESEEGGLRSINLRKDVPYLREVVQQHEIGLIVIDPLSSFLAASDRNSEGDVRDTLQPLVQLMEETGVVVIGIMHIGKSDGHQRAMQRLMGSTAFTALARSVWMVNNLPADLQDETQPIRKMLGVSKSNYAVPPVPLVFSRSQDGPIEFHGPSPIGIEEVFTWKAKSENDGNGRGSQAEIAEAFLVEHMTDQPVAASEMEAAAKEAGISATVLRRAKMRLGIRSVKRADGWVWLPPVEEAAA